MAAGTAKRAGANWLPPASSPAVAQVDRQRHAQLVGTRCRGVRDSACRPPIDRGDERVVEAAVHGLRRRASGRRAGRRSCRAGDRGRASRITGDIGAVAGASASPIERAVSRTTAATRRTGRARLPTRRRTSVPGTRRAIPSSAPRRVRERVAHRSTACRALRCRLRPARRVGGSSASRGEVDDVASRSMPTDAVGHRVVHLHRDRRARSPSGAVEAFDEGELPQRAGAVEARLSRSAAARRAAPRSVPGPASRTRRTWKSRSNVAFDRPARRPEPERR